MLCEVINLQILYRVEAFEFVGVQEFVVVDGEKMPSTIKFVFWENHLPSIMMKN